MDIFFFQGWVISVKTIQVVPIKKVFTCIGTGTYIVSKSFLTTKSKNTGTVTWYLKDTDTVTWYLKDTGTVTWYLKGFVPNKIRALS